MSNDQDKSLGPFHSDEASDGMALSDEALNAQLATWRAPAADTRLQSVILQDFDALSGAKRDPSWRDHIERYWGMMADALGVRARGGRQRAVVAAPIGAFAGLSLVGFAAGMASANASSITADETAGLVYVESAFETAFTPSDSDLLYLDDAETDAL